MNVRELRSMREEEIRQFEKECHEEFARRVESALEVRSVALAAAERRRSRLANMSDQLVWVRGRSGAYHASRFCACLRRRDGVSRYSPMLEDEAVERGHEPCQRCHPSAVRRSA